ncbi:MAG: class I SAM-dependent RNA methyltransferase [Amaricoccus sp.]|uniref:class I SAM-dependent RNA methyltransferase n=1 Tax=Amaricoccus sp. TaxID=1872485 RepID=UPI0039E3419C
MSWVVRIERLGREGDGIAGADRVPFALPGEAWRIGAVPELLEPVPERVAPPCPHFGSCGGCALQHAAPGWLAGWKAGTVVRALAAQRIEAEVRPTLTSPVASRRRAVFAGRRTRKAALVGFHGRRSDTVVAVPDCRVVRPEIVAGLPALQALAGLAASRSSTVRLAVTSGPVGLDVAVEGGRPLDAPLAAEVAGVAEEFDLARVAWEGEPVAARRAPWLAMGRARVVPPPGAFLQATAEGEAALVAAVRGIVGDAGRVLDLFAGCGTFSLPLAEGASVVAVEGEAAMLAALGLGAKAAAGLRPVRTLARDLFRRPLLAAELAAAEAVVIDPPRAGAEAQARELAASGVARVAAVSCNPASFARDARILIDGGYRLEWVQPVDQFLWSGHVELVAAFGR